MAEVKLELGAKLDLLNKDELGRVIDDKAGHWIRQTIARGLKRMPFFATGMVTAAGLVIGDSSVPGGPVLGPEEGWAWKVERITVTGWAAPSGGSSLTTSGTVTDPGAGASIASLTGVPPGTYLVQANTLITGTVTAADGSNMSAFTINGTPAGAGIIYPGTAGATGSTSFTAVLTATGTIGVSANAAASGAAAVYSAQITATPVASSDLIRLYKGNVGGTSSQRRAIDTLTYARQAAYPGRGCILMPGDNIVAAAGPAYTGMTMGSPVGTLWTLAGEAIEAPGEQIWKLAGG